MARASAYRHARKHLGWALDVAAATAVAAPERLKAARAHVLPCDDSRRREAPSQRSLRRLCLEGGRMSSAEATVMSFGDDTADTVLTRCRIRF